MSPSLVYIVHPPVPAASFCETHARHVKRLGKRVTTEGHTGSLRDHEPLDVGEHQPDPWPGDSSPGIQQTLAKLDPALFGLLYQKKVDSSNGLPVACGMAKTGDSSPAPVTLCACLASLSFAPCFSCLAWQRWRRLGIVRLPLSRFASLSFAPCFSCLACPLGQQSRVPRGPGPGAVCSQRRAGGGGGAGARLRRAAPCPAAAPPRHDRGRLSRRGRAVSGASPPRPRRAAACVGVHCGRTRQRSRTPPGWALGPPVRRRNAETRV